MRFLGWEMIVLFIYYFFINCFYELIDLYILNIRVIKVDLYIYFINLYVM